MAYIDWEGASTATPADVLRDFQDYRWDDETGDRTYEPLEIAPNDIELIIAFYEYEAYSGRAFVVYRDRRDGKFYEVNGSHCSCYRLEGQWAPEEVVVAEIIQRPEYVYCWGDAESREINGAMRNALLTAFGATLI